LSHINGFLIRIAPLEAFTPLHLCKSATTSSDDMAGYVVTFNQPWSISLLRYNYYYIKINLKERIISSWSRSVQIQYTKCSQFVFIGQTWASPA